MMTDFTIRQGEQVPVDTKFTYRDMGDGTHALVLAAEVINLASSVTETTGTFGYDETSAAEQDLVEIALTARALVGSIWLDFVNVTQDTTIRVYHKIDGTNYREFYSPGWADASDSDGVLIDGFTAQGDIKISLQCTGDGVGLVDVPYAVV